MVCTNIVTYEMNRLDVLYNLTVQVFQKRNEFLLPFADITLPKDLTRTRVKRSEQIEGSGTLILMLMPIGQVLRLSGQCGSPTGTRLQGRLLIDGQYHLLGVERPCIKLAEFRDRGIEGDVPRLFRMEPDMMAPRFELMRGQNPTHGGGRDILDNAIHYELSGQLGTIPLGEATAQGVGSFAGQAHHVHRDFGGKTRLWRRGQGRP